MIEIDAKGWRIVVKPPVHFHRIRGMLPLPVPVAGGSIELLRPFLNIEPAKGGDSDPSGQFTLTVGWIVGAFRGNGPYAILVALGEQGAAKSTFCRLMRELVDPNVAPLRDPPADKRELAISGANAHLLAYDNISEIPNWLSDAWCRRASGAGTGVRELYTDDEEVLTNRSNPMTANGIAEFVDRPDLAERSLFINLLPISDADRKTEEQFSADFAAAHPKILGAIFDLLSAGLRRIEEVRKRGFKLPRMADFALWAIACTEETLGKGTFKKHYEENIQNAVSTVLEASPVAQALIAEMEDGGLESLALTAGQWLKTLSDRVGKRISKSRDFPSTPRKMSAQLKRADGYLRKVGFDVSPSKPSGHKRDRLIVVTRIVFSAKKSSGPSSASSAGAENGENLSNDNDLNEDDSAGGEKGQSSAFDPFVREDGAGPPDSNPPEPQNSTSDRWGGILNAPVMEVIARAAVAGVRLSVNEHNGRLHVEGRGDVPKSLMGRIRNMRDPLVAVLVQGAQTRLEQARERHAPFLRIVEAARPPDVSEDHWKTAVDGLKVFLLSGWGDEAERLGWPRDELYRVPELWSQIHLFGAALLVSDCEVIEVTAGAIRIKTASGAIWAFYRRPKIDYGLAYRERIRMAGEDGRIDDSRGEEVRLRALEAVVNLYRNHHPGGDVDTAKLAVLAAIAAAAKPKEKA